MRKGDRRWGDGTWGKGVMNYTRTGQRDGEIVDVLPGCNELYPYISALGRDL